MKNTEFVSKLKDIATNHKTLYVMGCFGAPMNAANKKRYCNNHDYNKKPERTAMIEAASADTFGFDCVCLIKGVLWGWKGDKSKTYGGASYASNGVPDIGADTIIKKCSEVSTTGWADMVPGELVWMSGHVGIYIGDGLAVECTPKWDNKVQITAVTNIGTKSGYNGRKWTKHGKLPYVEYVEEETKSEADTKVESEPAALKVGDIVDFTGKVHYASANAKAGPACKPGKAKVTGIYKTGKHPYHLVRVTGGGSTVYGWVDAADIAGLAAEEETPWVPAVGDIVTYNGDTHYVSSNSNNPKKCKGGKAKITGIYRSGKHPYHLVRVAGGGATVYGWVDANSFTKG